MWVCRRCTCPAPFWDEAGTAVEPVKAHARVRGPLPVVLVPAAGGQLCVPGCVGEGQLGLNGVQLDLHVLEFRADVGGDFPADVADA